MTLTQRINRAQADTAEPYALDPNGPFVRGLERRQQPERRPAWLERRLAAADGDRFQAVQDTTDRALGR